jgi:NTE family protein
MEGYNTIVDRPFVHLVDGGVSDNVGMRAVLDAMEVLEALQHAGVPTQLERARRIVIFVVNSLSSPPTDWENPRRTIDICSRPPAPR